ncbi:MAG: metallophosphoesterase [Clostridia bacterium]|nr:metallophosphoesterase [Clostridia bacterium]
MNSAEKYIFDMHMRNLNTKWEDFSREIVSLQTENTFSIIYATDVHYIRKYALNVAAYEKLKEMVDFSGFAGIDLLAITGDIVDGNTTIKRQYRDLYDVMGVIKQAKTTSVLLSKGNHDDCSWYSFQKGLDKTNWLSHRDWYTHVVNPIRVQYPMVLDDENITGGYYYIDYPLQKIRVINLNTSDTTEVLNDDGTLIKEYCGQWCLAISEKQLKWLAKALTFTDEGWSVLIMSHNFLIPTNGAEEVHNGNAAWELICAYKNNTKGKIVSTDKYYEAELEYDFTQNPSNDVLPYMFGHIHEDFVTVSDGITAISSQNLLKADGTEWNNLDVNITGGWDCVLIDKKERTFKSRRFGVPAANRNINF